MSIFKRFGTSSRSKHHDKHEKESSAHIPKIEESPSKKVPSIENRSKDMDDDEAEARAAAAQLDLPFRSGKKSRNLSISRSGRHKYRANKRASVVNDNVFNSPANETSTGGGSTTPVYCRASGDCRDTKPHGGITQTSMARTPTAV